MGPKIFEPYQGQGEELMTGGFRESFLEPVLQVRQQLGRLERFPPGDDQPEGGHIGVEFVNWNGNKVQVTPERLVGVGA